MSSQLKSEEETFWQYFVGDFSCIVCLVPLSNANYILSLFMLKMSWNCLTTENLRLNFCDKQILSTVSWHLIVVFTKIFYSLRFIHCVHALIFHLLINDKIKYSLTAFILSSRSFRSTLWIKKKTATNSGEKTDNEK